MKGCLGWACAIIGWFVLWGTCMAIGDANHISPFWVLFLFVVGIIIIGIIGLLIFNYFSNKEAERLQRKRNKCQSLQSRFPNAFRKFCYNNRISTYRWNIYCINQREISKSNRWCFLLKNRRY